MSSTLDHVVPVTCHGFQVFLIKFKEMASTQEKARFAFCYYPWSVKKENSTLFGKYKIHMYILSREVKISAFHRATHS